MGAQDFTMFVKGASIARAYANACRDCRDEYGAHYTGTIAETEGYIQKLFTPLTQAAAGQHAGGDIDNCSKWGPAYAIPVASDSHFTFKTVKLTVTVPATQTVTDEWDESTVTRATSRFDLEDAVRKQVRDKYGDAVHKVEIIPKLGVKTVIDAPKGRSVLRYAVAGPWGGRDKLYPTRAAAIKAAREQLKGDTGSKVQVRAVRYWPESDTAAAATVSNETTSASAQVTVTLATRKKADTPIEGWLFYGIASC